MLLNFFSSNLFLYPTVKYCKVANFFFFSGFEAKNGCGLNNI